MIKNVVITYQIDDEQYHDDMDGIIRALQADKYQIALGNICSHLRSMHKYRNFTEEQCKVLEEIKEYVYNEASKLLSEY